MKNLFHRKEEPNQAKDLSFTKSYNDLRSRILNWRLALIVLLFSFNTVNEVHVNNFTVVDKSIIYQKVFETELSFDQICSRMQLLNTLKGVTKLDRKITGNFSDVKPKYKESGFSYMSTVQQWTSSTFSGFATIEYKEGRYRVTIRDIKARLEYTGQDMILPIEEFSLNRDGNVKKHFINEGSLILDRSFTDYFNFKRLEIVDSDW